MNASSAANFLFLSSKCIKNKTEPSSTSVNFISEEISYFRAKLVERTQSVGKEPSGMGTFSFRNTLLPVFSFCSGYSFSKFFTSTAADVPPSHFPDRELRLEGQGSAVWGRVSGLLSERSGALTTGGWGWWQPCRVRRDPLMRAYCPRQHENPQRSASDAQHWISSWGPNLTPGSLSPTRGILEGGGSPPTWVFWGLRQNESRSSKPNHPSVPLI